VTRGQEVVGFVEVLEYLNLEIDVHGREVTADVVEDFGVRNRGRTDAQR
jgi:hypothetical protein